METGVTGMAVGIQKSTIARAIQTIVQMLMKNPNFPKEKVECLTALRPRRRETKIGMPYDTDKQIVATPVKALNADVDPK